MLRQMRLDHRQEARGDGLRLILGDRRAKLAREAERGGAVRDFVGGVRQPERGLPPFPRGGAAPVAGGGAGGGGGSVSLYPSARPPRRAG